MLYVLNTLEHVNRYFCSPELLTKRINLYRVDKKYTRNLHKIEDIVDSCNAAEITKEQLRQTGASKRNGQICGTVSLIALLGVDVTTYIDHSREKKETGNVSIAE